MRDLFQQCENKENVAKIARSHLELLIDGNYLKPTVWAESLQQNFAVSVAVRRYLRPLYLFQKLCDLSNMSNDISTTLDNVNAFECVNRSSKKFKKNHNKCHLFQSTYNIETPKGPCRSCNLFFKNEVPHVPDPNENPPPFNYLGNCAEFDLVQEADTAEKLSKIKDTDHWTTFKEGCEGHIGAFNNLNKDIPKRGNRLQREFLLHYYKETRETRLKTLKYKWNSSTSGYEIVARENVKNEEAVK